MQALFPPKSVLAKMGLECAVQRRQALLSCYLNKLAGELQRAEPHKDEVGGRRRRRLQHHEPEHQAKGPKGASAAHQPLCLLSVVTIRCCASWT